MPLRIQFKAITDSRPYRVYGNQKYQGKYINHPAKMGKASLAVLPCLSHEDAVTVPVEVVMKGKGEEEFKVIGTGKACPLCWELLKKDF